MLNQFSRTQLLLGVEAMDKLKNSRVAVFGIGGVGGYVCEALVRSGVGQFDLIDDDKVCLTNINRQIIATRKSVGQYKVDVMKERMVDINPDVTVNIHKCFFLPENADEFPFDEYDYVVDAVDTVTAKIALVMKCQEKGVPIISIYDIIIFLKGKFISIFRQKEAFMYIYGDVRIDFHHSLFHYINLILPNTLPCRYYLSINI